LSRLLDGAIFKKESTALAYSPEDSHFVACSSKPSVPLIMKIAN